MFLNTPFLYKKDEFCPLKSINVWGEIKKILIELKKKNRKEKMTKTEILLPAVLVSLIFSEGFTKEK
mgnify:FL=1